MYVRTRSTNLPFFSLVERLVGWSFTLKWLDPYFTGSMALTAERIRAVGPFVSVPGCAETLASVSAVRAFLPLGSAPVYTPRDLSLIHISEPTRLLSISYAVF